MSLTVGAILLGLAAVTAPILRHERSGRLDLNIWLVVVVLLLARGPEPAQTYVHLAACALAATLIAAAYGWVDRSTLHRLRAELLLLSGVVVTILLSAFVLPDSRAAQLPALAVIVLFGAAFLVTGLAYAGIVFARALRRKPRSTRAQRS